jgi:hypothetical protein
MNTPRHAASQFHFGEAVSVAAPGSVPKAVNGKVQPDRINGTIAGWNASNTACLIELENGERSYYRIQDIQPIEKSL